MSSIRVAREMCVICNTAVYFSDKIVADKQIMHKSCLKCTECNSVLSLGKYAALGGKYYCKPHFKQLFALKGNYDEGFGGTLHKHKWLAQDGAPAPAPSSASQAVPDDAPPTSINRSVSTHIPASRAAPADANLSERVPAPQSRPVAPAEERVKSAASAAGVLMSPPIAHRAKPTPAAAVAAKPAPAAAATPATPAKATPAAGDAAAEAQAAAAEQRAQATANQAHSSAQQRLAEARRMLADAAAAEQEAERRLLRADALNGKADALEDRLKKVEAERDALKAELEKLRAATPKVKPQLPTKSAEAQAAVPTLSAIDADLSQLDELDKLF
jgi:hypothetical protein